jgi:hypothetical protein
LGINVLTPVGLAFQEACIMDEHVPGSMDIRAQEKTFAGFMRMSMWGAIIAVLVLIVMALANA